MKVKTHQLSLDDTFEDEAHLIAIYSDEEDFRMAYLLNFHFQLHLSKTHAIVQPKTLAKFCFFEYKDHTHFRDWFLLYNYNLKQHKKVQSDGLFADMETILEKPIYYMNELSKAKFLLKIVADEPDSFYEILLNKLKSIPQIYTAELINLQKIKNKDLLNF